MEKISIVRRRSERKRGTETAALLRARSRTEEQHTDYPLAEIGASEPETVASLPEGASPRKVVSLPKAEHGADAVAAPSPNDEPGMNDEGMSSPSPLGALQSVLPLEEMEIGESREVPVVVTKTSASKAALQLGWGGEPLLTTEDVCRILRVSKSFLYRKIQEGRVPYLRIGRRYRFRRTQVIEALTHEGGPPIIKI